MQRNLELDIILLGVDQDQSCLAPNNVLMSVIKNVGSYLYEITKDYLDTNNFDGGKVKIRLLEMVLWCY
ncbi:BMP family ABC transporter substrate-binding protein [Borrelia anserina]|uniref:BMP family ABC transporter substrate-binding protein n=1 Tax=Borrelia anserina TaxID=143 RepID=UPI001E44865E|nr:BMP family ABC transporter substrate-binding protein [Borrelia anserina]